MFIFAVALLHLCLTDFSLSAALQRDEDFSIDDTQDFVVEDSFLKVPEVLTMEMQEGVGPKICRVLSFTKFLLDKIRVAYRDLKDDEGIYNSTEIRETKENFEKQCNELVTFVDTPSNSTDVNFIEKFKTALTIKRMLQDLKYLLLRE